MAKIPIFAAPAKRTTYRRRYLMFLEHTGTGRQRRGWIEVICGSMFSGKTEELIRRLRRAEFARQKVEIFKPEVDVRYAQSEVVSHDRTSIRSTPIPNSSNLLLMASDVEVVGIDEAQFFDDGLPQVCEQLASTGIRVIVAGLDMDFQGRPFGPIPQMLSMAEYVTKVHAICSGCGSLASFSHRKTASKDLILLGETDSYQPLCRECFNSARAGSAIAELSDRSGGQ